VVYVPGGGFVGGDKRLPDLPYYNHIGWWAVEHGMVAVTVNYRLAPGHPWPAGAEDVGAAVAWTRAHIADHGGDPARIVLLGHSAGATHIASFLAGHSADHVAAAVMLSGIYDAPEAGRHESDPARHGTAAGVAGRPYPILRLPPAGPAAPRPRRAPARAARPHGRGTGGAMRTVAVEEHFWTPDLARVAGMELVAPAGGPGDRKLRDLGPDRLADMDAAGIDVQVISHAAPAAQHLSGAESRARAAAANDVLAAAVQAHPDRFAGLATLPTTDPAAAADELERCVRELGFVGAMVNNTFGTNGRFLDDPTFGPLLHRFEALGVPLYLHPSAAPESLLYQGFPPHVTALLATSSWGWHAELGLHALRMVVGGVFDRHPGLRLVLGHGGELIPFLLDRIDRQFTGLPRPPSWYLLNHVWITTSGLFSLPPLLCALQVFGVDRVLFAVDYPFSPNEAGRAVLDALPLSPVDRAKVAAGNADELFGLPLPRR
jgi:predicted TIM-barrel fold metal-dependent hydrolase